MSVGSMVSVLQRIAAAVEVSRRGNTRELERVFRGLHKAKAGSDQFGRH